MYTKNIDLNCIGCGSPVSTSIDFCEHCKRPIVITSFTSVYGMANIDVNKYVNTYNEVLKEKPGNSTIHTSIGMCYLKLRLYEKAFEFFEKAILNNFDHSETYFYAAVCLLKGKKAFLTPKADIEKAIQYINAAFMIENRGVYNYLLAYIKYDFYERKYLRIFPTYTDELENALINNVTKEDIRILFELLNVEKPSIFTSFES